MEYEALLMICYVKNRYQCVKVENEISDELLVKYSVPQGSVLGPLLFLLYINDLKNVIGQSNCRIITLVNKKLPPEVFQLI